MNKCLWITNKVVAGTRDHLFDDISCLIATRRRVQNDFRLNTVQNDAENSINLLRRNLTDKCRKSNTNSINVRLHRSTCINQKHEISYIKVKRIQINDHAKNINILKVLVHPVEHSLLFNFNNKLDYERNKSKRREEVFFLENRFVF